MSSFRQQFRNTHTFLPVIHVEGPEHALKNARIAQGEGADGVFLISHEVGFGYRELVQTYEYVRARLPDFYLGVNFLELEPRRAIREVPEETTGLWCDDGGISSDPIDSAAYARLFSEVRSGLDWKGIHFGGVAFKGQPAVGNVAVAARQARVHIDVVTTSGQATGIPPQIEKIQAMRNAIGDHPLAIASGMSYTNVDPFLPYVDCFLVATGISVNCFGKDLDPVTVRAFARKLNK